MGGAPPPFRPPCARRRGSGPPPLPRRAGRRSPALAHAARPTARLRICVGGEMESIFSSPLSSRCKLHAAMPHLLEMNFVRHSIRRDAKMTLHSFVGVGLIVTRKMRSSLNN